MRKVALLGLTALVALALGFLVGPGPEAAGGSPGWTTFRDSSYGFTVKFPSAWKRARTPLVSGEGDPSVIPNEIISVGTGQMRVGGGGECGFYPAAAMAAMGPRDVLVSVKQYTGAEVSGRVRQYRPGRPARVAIHNRPRTSGRVQRPARYGELNRPGEIRSQGLSPHADWTELEFRDHQRLIRALVAIGIKAAPRARHQALQVLDSLRFGPSGGGDAGASG